MSTMDFQKWQDSPEQGIKEEREDFNLKKRKMKIEDVI